MSQKQYSLHLKGFVGGADFDRNYVDYVLDKNADKTVDVLIDSLGGNLATALSIASAFERHGNVNVHFVGMNASAATIASLGAAHVSIDRNAMYLVHKCSTSFFEWGSLNADQFRTLISDCEKAASDLDKLDVNVASMYARKCKKEPEALLDLMKVGGWLNAKDALEWGFVDEITDLADEPAPKLTNALASEISAAGIPVPNIPFVDKENAFALFIDRLSSFFASKYKQQTVMELKLKSLCALLEIEHFDVIDGKASITEEHLNAIEQVFNVQKAAIADLEEQVAKLKSAPAASSQQVVDDTPHNAQQDVSDFEQFCQNFNEARKLYDSI